jgi:hypothetical protein
MTAFNVVRFRVKPGREHDFLDAHKRVEASWSGVGLARMIGEGESHGREERREADDEATTRARPKRGRTICPTRKSHAGG